jgi:hypothetical protein
MTAMRTPPPVAGSFASCSRPVMAVSMSRGPEAPRDKISASTVDSLRVNGISRGEEMREFVASQQQVLRIAFLDHP